VRGRRCPGRPFYRRPREGERRSSVGPSQVHSAGINAAQRRRRDLTAGAVPGKDVVKQRGRGGAELSCAARGWARGRRWRGRRWRGRQCVVRVEDDEAADRWGRSASEREREEWLAGGAGSSAREREGSAERLRAREAGRQWAERGKARARGVGEAAAAWAGFAPAGGRRRAFSFSFYFLIPISIFVYFPFEQFI
jgi:hypothetical protein